MGIFAQIKDRVGNRLRLDSTFGAARTSYSPLEYQSFVRGGGHYAIGLAVAVPANTAANAVLIGVRNPGPNVMVLQRVRLGSVVNTVLAAATVAGATLISGRQFTVPYSTAGTILDAGRGGTAITQQACKCRSSMAPTGVQMTQVVSGAVGISGATVALDASPFAQMSMPFPSTAVGNGFPIDIMYEAIGNHQYPQVYDPSEGFVIANGATALPLTGSITVFVTIEWAEVPTF